MKQEYINNDKDYGRAYDMAQVVKDFNSLKIPKDVYSPLECLQSDTPYKIILSERSIGKTTNVFLLALCYVKQGATISYIREKHEQITPKKTKSLFKTIIAYNYINKLFPEYNSVTYKSRYWYLCHIDDRGNIDKQDNRPFMVVMSLDETFDYKSTFNSDDTDIIIYDEFISNYYRKDLFVDFMDLHKTISRERLSVLTFMLSNTIDLENDYFYEFMIADEIKSMMLGDKRIVTSEKGTKIYVELVDNKIRKKKKKKTNSMYYGFDNPKLAAITGEGWSFENYPHIVDFGESELILNNYYIRFNNNLLRINLYKCDELGLYVTCHKATKFYDDSIIYTLDNIKSHQERYSLGYTKIDKLLFNLWKRNKWYYSNNSVGLIVEKYVNACKSDNR